MRTTAALSGLGGLIIVGAAGWWWITYGEVVGYGYLSWREAGGCLVHNSDICTLAKALCLGSHPRALIAYWTSAFWLGLIVLSVSLLTVRPAKAFE
jgi:hypothetical protein